MADRNGIFQFSQFIFLIVGHTKNACDRLFNLLKKLYRLNNIYTMSQLFTALDGSRLVSIHEATAEDFFDWDEYLGLFYSSFTGKIKHNHIFECSMENRVGNQLQVDLRESALAEHTVEKHNAFKCGFAGREDHPSGGAGLKEAIADRKGYMIRHRAALLKQLEPPGINVYKQYELSTKYKKIVPEEAKDDVLYKDLSEKIKKMVRDERKMRKNFSQGLNAMKSAAAKKELKRTIEKIGE